MKSPMISDEELKAFAEAILKRHGIDFTGYEPVSLKRRIHRAIDKLGVENLYGLWKKLIDDPTFVYLLMDELSVGLTTMFRDPILWRALKEEVARRFSRAHSIKIWHSGCSTGEEVLTMSIVLMETGMHAITNSLATDMSTNAINSAKAASYDHIKGLEFEHNYHEYNPVGSLKRYYSEADARLVFRPELLRRTDFCYHNLMSDTIDTPDEQYDIIFCRNVMIYFDTESKVKLMTKFHKALKPGGLFVVGFYDAVIPLIDRNLFDVLNQEAKILQTRQYA